MLINNITCLYIYIYIFIYINISAQNHCSQLFALSALSESWHWLGIPHPANGAKKARKKTVFSWTGSSCVRSPHRFQQTWCHPSENPAVATKNSNTHLKDENIQKFCETAKIQKYKNLLKRLPTGPFWASWGGIWVKITCPTRLE